jgi:hypothetical protein
MVKVDDVDITDDISISPPAAHKAPPAQVQAPLLPTGPITQAQAKELNYIMLLKNEGPQE